MSVQDNLAISQPQFAEEISTITLVSEKDKKKQQEDLAHLAALLTALKEALAGAKSEASGKPEGKIVNLNPPSSTNGNNGTPSLADAMAAMVRVLELLQVKIVQEGQKKASLDEHIAQIQVQLSNASLKKTVEQLQKLATMSFWEKIAEWFVALVSAVAAVVTMNPELLAVTVLSVLAATGALSSITSGVSSVLQDMGMSKDEANIFASVFVVVITIVASFGMGALSAPEAVAEDAGDIAMEEVTEQVASQVTELGAESSSNASAMLQKVLGGLKKLNSLLGPGVKSAIMGAFQSISQTGMLNNIVEATNVSDQEKQKLEEILGIVVAVLAVVSTIGVSLGSSSSSVNQLTQKLIKEAGFIFKALSYGQAFGGLTQAAFTTAQGVFEKFLADAKADLELVQAAQQMINTQTSEDQKNLATLIKNSGVDPRTIRELVAGYAAMANLIAEHSPVK